MGSIDSAISRILHIEEKIDMLLTLLKDKQYQELPEWFDLRKACEYKGLNYDTVKNRRTLQPDSSKIKVMCNKRMWPREVILEWANQDDKDLNYIAKPKYPNLQVAG